MKYQIVYDNWGRLRLRCGQYAFSKKQGYGIESLLSAEKGVLQVRASWVNGGILIQYEEGAGLRERILKTVARLKRSELQEAEASPDTKLREIDEEFRRNLAKMLIKRFVLRRILPYPVRVL